MSRRLGLWVLTAGAFSALGVSAFADTVGLATAHIRKNWDVFSVVVNSGDEPIRVSADGTVVEGPHDYRSVTVPRITLQPGEAKLIHGLIHQFRGSGHYHTNISMDKVSGAHDPDHHSHGIQYFSVLIDTQGNVNQILGPAPHGDKPTNKPLGIANRSRVGTTYGVVGYETYKGYRAVVVITNGSRPNRIDVRATVSELVGGSDCGACEIYYKDFGTVAPNAVVVARVENKEVEWAHHLAPSVGMSISGGATWYTLYQDDQGAVYGMQDKFAYTGGILGGSSDSLPAISSSTLAPGELSSSTQPASVIVGASPVLSWGFPGSLPAGFTLADVDRYVIEVSSNSSFDPLVVDTATSSGVLNYTITQALEPDKNYFWRVGYRGLLPGIPQLNPNARGPNLWDSSMSRTLKIRTSP